MYKTTLTRDQIKRIIAHVEFTSKDTSLPVLNAVHIVADGYKITVSSTDRYVLAESTIAVSEWEGETASATIPAADITAWKNLAKTSQMFQFTIEGDTWALDAGPSKASGRTVTGEYPKVGSLFPEDRVLHPITPTGLSVANLDKLGKFSRAAGVPTSERTWRIGQARPDGKGTAPIIALIDGTRALIMPITGPNRETAPEGYRLA